jgi:hypothetical protein
MTVRSNIRRLTILAQDPAVKLGGFLAFTQVDVPAEMLSDGPVGYRVKVVDFDASANVLYKPLRVGRSGDNDYEDEFVVPSGLSASARRKWEADTLTNPAFHAQNVYAIVMRTLARFEFALGRRVAWGFPGHQIHVAPHAFCEANAFYSEEDRALFFGYFPSLKSGKNVYTCLSHDIVAHETTHALIDGLRDGFTNPSSPDQAAFHEGFADVVALLSVFSLREIVEAALVEGQPRRRSGQNRLIPRSAVMEDAISRSILLGLAKEFGAEADATRANCLRRSIELPPRKDYLTTEKYQEEHDRGEVFAATMLRSFLTLWLRRIAALGTFEGDQYSLDLVVDAGVKAADHLLTMAIRAIDYCPPVDLSFGDYLAALLTADAETAPDDGRYEYRKLIRGTFAAYGIEPPSECTDPETGCWATFDRHVSIAYHRTHFESMLHDSDEVFRFVWENRHALELSDYAYTKIRSVRPSFRQGPDGFIVRETICEYVQVARLFGAEVQAYLKVSRPADMPATQPITAYGGGTLVFDQYGRIKYHIAQRLEDGPRQLARLRYLWERGFLERAQDARNRFASLHRNRVA